MSDIRRGQCPECGRLFDSPVSQCPSCAVGLVFQKPPMTTNDKWVRERAEWTAERAMSPTWQEHGMIAPLIEAALQEAIERTHAEERAHATQALKLAHEMQDKAVAAERERCEERIEALFAREKQKLEEYVAESCEGDDPIKSHARTIAQGRLAQIDVLRSRLALTLAGQEDTDV